MIIFGIDAGLTAPGFAVVETSETNPIGKVLMAECFIPEWKTGDDGKKLKIRKTAQDAWRISQIVRRMFEIYEMHNPNVIIAELPTGGAKSGAAIRGMAYSTAMTTAFFEGVEWYSDAESPLTEIVPITPIENKKGSTGKEKWDVDIDQGKWEVFNAVKAFWPDVQWPHKKRKTQELDDGKCWAMADALSCVATYLRNTGVIRAAQPDSSAPAR